MATAVSLAVFYELFWLDLFPAGTYMPPNSLFPMLAVFTYAGLLPHPGITTLFLPVILTLPLAILGAFIEKRHREWQVPGYNRVTQSLRAGDDVGKAASRSVAFSLGQLFLMNFAVFILAVSLILLAVEGLSLWKHQPPTFAHASWPLLWVMGAVGGVLALRIRRNYIIFVAGSVCICLVALFWSTW